jgi:hypothetical protein
MDKFFSAGIEVLVMGSRLAFACGDNYPYLALLTGLLYGVLQRPDNLNNPSERPQHFERLTSVYW